MNFERLSMGLLDIIFTKNRLLNGNIHNENPRKDLTLDRKAVLYNAVKKVMKNK